MPTTDAPESAPLHRCYYANRGRQAECDTGRRARKVNQPRRRCACCRGKCDCLEEAATRLLLARAAKEKALGRVDEGDEPPLPDGPTDAHPGTRGKVNAMRDRLRKGLAIFHPCDPPLVVARVTLGFKED